LQKVAKETVNWQSISEADMNTMVRCLEEARLLKKTGMRSLASAHTHDVRHTTKRVSDEVCGVVFPRSIFIIIKQLQLLQTRCNTSSMALTVRTASAHHNNPIYYLDATSHSFIEVVLGMSADDFCIKYEAYAMCGLAGAL
jgi:hypothetical protein